MDKELHLHKRVDICEEQTIYKLRQFSACDRDWRPAWLQPGQRLITGPGVGAVGEREGEQQQEQRQQQLATVAAMQERREKEGGGGGPREGVWPSAPWHILNFKLSAEKLRHI